MANEKRLIDANALMEEIDFEYDLNYGEILTDPVKFADMVDDAPTVDAVEVVHGRWIEKIDMVSSYFSGCEEVFAECSVCHAAEISGSNYCPNCGAKMDGDGNG